ncbi:unnamed protein product [Amoebophrya sp. A25]|nr:unnamed protein product [Amoebophrya sp. A25]|eukprot:GSA25T00011415001.1
MSRFVSLVIASTLALPAYAAVSSTQLWRGTSKPGTVEPGDFVELTGWKGMPDLNGSKGLVLFNRKLIDPPQKDPHGQVASSTARSSGFVAPKAAAAFFSSGSPSTEDDGATRWAVLVYNDSPQRIISVKADNVKKLELTKIPMDAVLSPELFRSSSACDVGKTSKMTNRFIVSPRTQLKRTDDEEERGSGPGGDIEQEDFYEDASMGEQEQAAEDGSTEPLLSPVYKKDVDRAHPEWYRDVYDVGLIVNEMETDDKISLALSWKVKVWWFKSQKFSWEDLQIPQMKHTGVTHMCSIRALMTKERAIVEKNTRGVFLLGGPRNRPGEQSSSSDEETQRISRPSSLLSQGANALGSNCSIRANPVGLAEVRRAIEVTENLQQRVEVEKEHSVFQQHVIDIATMDRSMSDVERRQKETLFQRFESFRFRQNNGFGNDRIYRFVKRRGRIMLEFFEYGERRGNDYTLNLDRVAYLDFSIKNWPHEITDGVPWMLNKSWPNQQRALFASRVLARDEAGDMLGVANYPIELSLLQGPATEVFRRTFPYQKDKIDRRDKPSPEDGKAGRGVPEWIAYTEHYSGETKPDGKKNPYYEEIKQDEVLHVLPDRFLKMWNSSPVTFERRMIPPFYQLEKDEERYRPKIPE